MGKQRITVTVDDDIADAARASAAGSHAESLSAWVGDAIAEKVAHQRRLDAARAALAAFESEFGEITDAEMATAQRSARERAVVVRGRKSAGAA